jgi:hypothetical protein
MKKKTLPIGAILEKANHTLANSIDELSAERKAIANFVSNLLHDSGNYKGFGYLATEKDSHAGCWGESGRIFFCIADHLKEDYQAAQIKRLEIG